MNGRSQAPRGRRTFWVTEEAPPVWPPWACEGRNFDSATEAIAWASRVARTVIVRTLAGRLYYVGEAPSAGVSGPVEPWPGEKPDSRPST